MRYASTDAQNATRMTWTVDYEPFDDGLAAGWTAFLTKFIVSSAADELAKIASGEDQIPSPVERFVVRRLLDWFRDSDLVEKEHAKHIASPTVSHLLKGTPLVDAADDNKLVFASSYLGRLVARVVKEEGEYLSEWKVAKIVEAAGPTVRRGGRARKTSTQKRRAPTSWSVWKSTSMSGAPDNSSLKPFLGDDAANKLAPSSGEEPASPRHRAGDDAMIQHERTVKF